MSAFLLGKGFKANMGTCVRKLVLLKLIDACEDDGSRIFPAVATVATAAQCSTRQVQRELRTFVEIGLLWLVREGGKGRRSTNEYAMDLAVLDRIAAEGWDAVAGAKGDTVSPLEDDVKGDTGDALRVTPESPKGDTRSHTTPPDSSIDPSLCAQARAAAAGAAPEREDRRKVEQDFKRWYPTWKTYVSDSEPEARKAWFDLSPEDRAQAVARTADYLAAVKASGRTKLCAASKYLVERRWEKLGDPLPPAESGIAVLPPYGSAWMARRLALLAGSERREWRMTAFQQRLHEAGKGHLLDAERRRAQFPEVRDMDDRAVAGQATVVQPGERADEGTLAGFVQIAVGSPEWEAWEDWHAERDWPWINPPSLIRFVWVPSRRPVCEEAESRMGAAR